MDNLLKNIVIRNISLDDAQRLKEINAKITKSEKEIDFRRVIQEQIQKRETDTSFVAELDGEIVGYMISYIVYSGFGLEKSAWITTLGVEPQYMGQGIGKSLADKLFEVLESKGIDFVYTSVMWDSIDLLSFFKTLGFDRSAFINLRKEMRSNH